MQNQRQRLTILNKGMANLKTNKEKKDTLR
jgi:hypothetical protein